MRLFPLLLLAACAAPPPPPARIPSVTGGTEPTVRVLLREAGARTKVVVRSDRGLRVETDASAFDAPGPLEITLEGGALLVRGRPEKRAFLKIRAAEGLLALDGDLYSGELLLRGGESIGVVNRVPLENYVLGVLRGELPLPAVPPEAAAAQAVAVRSYTIHYLEQERADHDVDDTILYQRYVGVRKAPRDDDLRAGVERTRGLLLLCDGRPLKAYYHSTCGGHTTDPLSALGEEDASPLHGVACDACGESRYFRWEKRIEGPLIARASGLTGTVREVSVAERSPARRATAIRVRTDKGERTLPARDFRLRLGPSLLRSTRIETIEPAEGGFLFRGGGWGHGVGLCQMGAIGMAKRGDRHPAILARYYPGALLARAY